MGKRDLLFWALIGGLTLLAGVALRLPESAAPFPDSAYVQGPGFNQLVQRLDLALFSGEDKWLSGEDRGLLDEDKQIPTEADDSSPKILSADDLTLARRLSLALVGTIPSLEEIRALEQQPTGERIASWTHTLLTDRRSAEYLAERIARSVVGVEEGPFLRYRRRRFVSWLSAELYENRPYDQIIRELVTSTGIWTDRPATNFITVTFQEETERADENKLAVRVCRAMLGIRLDCAQCHDHPFDGRWQQHDFQGLAAFFGGIESSLTGVYDVHEPYQVEDLETGQLKTVAPQVPFLPELLPQQGSRRQRLARWITNPQNGAFARATVNRFWALLLGRPLVAPVDDIPLDETVPPVLSILATEFAQHDYDLRWLIHTIVATSAFQAESRSPSQAIETPVVASEHPVLATEHPVVASEHPVVDTKQTAWSTDEPSWHQFSLARLRPEQVVGSLMQAASLATIHHRSHILIRLARYLQQNKFITRYGDRGSRELETSSGTIPQRLMLLNGHLLHEKTKENLVSNAATRIAVLAPNDPKAIEVAYLAVLTRRPTPTELAHFSNRLAGQTNAARQRTIEDLYWALLNSTEFSWNH
jgi:hypothetical protein